MSIENEVQIYNYVRGHASKYYKTIMSALHDGLQEENEALRVAKSEVEVAIVCLLEKTTLRKIDPQRKEVLKRALESCTFFKFDWAMKQLEDVDAQGLTRKTL